MGGIPFFIEAMDAQHGLRFCVCRAIMLELLKKNVFPLPSGRSLQEVQDVLGALKSGGITPSIFVVNTFLAESLVAKLDAVIGTTPALFFVRDATSESVILPRIEPAPGGESMIDLIGRMSERPNSVWSYSAANLPLVARKAAAMAAKYLGDGKFDHFASGEHAVLVPRSSARLPKASDVAPPPPPPAASVHGLLSQLSLSSLLMMFDMEKKSGELSLRTQDASGRFFLRKGRVIVATVSGPQVPEECRQGEEAVYLALRWNAGSFTFLQSEIELEAQMNAPTTQLLMEGARRMDEGGNG